MGYKTVAGLEIHAELLTEKKLFCRCLNVFGAEANANVCPVCSGLAGSMPVLNREAVLLAAKAGLALGCHVNERSEMARKHYLYPDLPKGYQITQDEMPLCTGGHLDIGGRRVRIQRIHIEEDAGKTTVKDGIRHVDLNRCGVPLIEIVTEPDIETGAQAAEFLDKLRLVLRTAGVSDCRMQEGSMRCDVNVSVETDGREGERTEIKNLNSISSVAAAVEYEASRLRAVIESGGHVVSETRSWDEKRGVTEPMRAKQTRRQYRYLAEPDIPPVVVTEEELRAISASMPELPDARRERMLREYGLSGEDAQLLMRYPAAADYFEETVGNGAAPDQAAALILTRVFAALPTEKERESFSPSVSPGELALLCKAVESGETTATAAKQALADALAQGGDVMSRLPERGGLSEGELISVCRRAIEANEKAVSDFLRGKDAAVKALVGAVMRETRGLADPAAAEKTLRNLLKQH